MKKSTKNLNKFVLSAIVLIIGLALFPVIAYAGTAGLAPDTTVGDKSTGGPVILNPAVNVGSPQQFIGRIINSALGIVGSLALLMFIYGGFVWLTSAGSSDKVTKGKNILVWATIGLVVIFMSYGATKFVLDKITAT